MLCVLIVEGMSVVVNVMLSLMSVMSPPPALCNLSLHTVVKLCTLGVFDFRSELGFLNCDDICMCVVNRQFGLLEFVYAVYIHQALYTTINIFLWEIFDWTAVYLLYSNIIICTIISNCFYH